MLSWALSTGSATPDENLSPHIPLLPPGLRFFGLAQRQLGGRRHDRNPLMRVRYESFIGQRGLFMELYDVMRATFIWSVLG